MHRLCLFVLFQYVTWNNFSYVSCGSYVASLLDIVHMTINGGGHTCALNFYLRKSIDILLQGKSREYHGMYDIILYIIKLQINLLLNILNIFTFISIFCIVTCTHGI